MVIFASKENKIHRGTINLYSSPLKAYPALFLTLLHHILLKASSRYLPHIKRKDSITPPFANK